MYIFFGWHGTHTVKMYTINTIGSCKVTEDDKLMEYDALLLDWFFDSYYPGFTGDDP